MFRLRKAGKQKAGKRKAGKARSPVGVARRIFHGVSIHGDIIDCCDAAQAIEGSRYLADEAPMLPLADCTNPRDCKCRYEHYDDRRTQLRRESDEGLPMKDHPEDIRRGDGRRVTDG